MPRPRTAQLLTSCIPHFATGEPRPLIHRALVPRPASPSCLVPAAPCPQTWSSTCWQCCSRRHPACPPSPGRNCGATSSVRAVGVRGTED
eukprot:6238933-Prymnesium_polylepis.1